MAQFAQSFCIPMFVSDNEPESYRAVIAHAAKIGYPAFEIWGRDWLPFETVLAYANEYGMTIPTMCGHGTLTDGLNRPENHARIRDEVLASLDVAVRAGIRNLICFTGNRYGLADDACLDIVADGLRSVAPEAEAAGVTLVLELLNSKVDHPDYQADHTAWGAEVVRRVDSPRVKLLYDIYHMQIMEGDLCRTITDNLPYLGHFHTAGNPGRHDMDETQEINYPAVIATLRASDYSGYVAHEFMPKGDPLQALEQAFRLWDAGVRTSSCNQ